MTYFASLLAAVESRGLSLELVGPGRAGIATDVPVQVAEIYAIADGMDRARWQDRYPGQVPCLLPMVEFLGEERAREFADMKRRNAELIGVEGLWNEHWWPLLTSEPKDVIAVHRVTGEVWFSYPEGMVTEVIAPSLDTYWQGCARWVRSFAFDSTRGYWAPMPGYDGEEGPWDPAMTWQ
jgi:hypothetical protein